MTSFLYPQPLLETSGACWTPVSTWWRRGPRATCPPPGGATWAWRLGPPCAASCWPRRPSTGPWRRGRPPRRGAPRGWWRTGNWSRGTNRWRSCGPPPKSSTSAGWSSKRRPAGNNGDDKLTGPHAPPDKEMKTTAENVMLLCDIEMQEWKGLDLGSERPCVVSFCFGGRMDPASPRLRQIPFLISTPSPTPSPFKRSNEGHA